MAHPPPTASGDTAAATAPAGTPEHILTIGDVGWDSGGLVPERIAALEAGKVLYFPNLAFTLSPDETRLLTPAVRDPKARNISLSVDGMLKGAIGDPATLAAMAGMIGRFQRQSRQLVDRMLPQYRDALRMAPTSYRPAKVETRAQSWRADDRRLHVDAFPSRPNHGERILRVFTNVNPEGLPRVWRIGEPFEAVARHFLPRTKSYAAWQARCLHALRITKHLRSEYDHLMLQLHDGMKADLAYQRDARQLTMAFPPGSTWVCFSDQTSHAVLSGQYMLEQTMHLPALGQYDRSASPLAILSRLTGRALI